MLVLAFGNHARPVMPMGFNNRDNLLEVDVVISGAVAAPKQPDDPVRRDDGNRLIFVRGSTGDQAGIAPEARGRVASLEPDIVPRPTALAYPEPPERAVGIANQNRSCIGAGGA